MKNFKKTLSNEISHSENTSKIEKKNASEINFVYEWIKIITCCGGKALFLKYL